LLREEETAGSDGGKTAFG